MGGLSKSDAGDASVEARLQNASLASGGNTHILSGNNLSLIAADVTAHGGLAGWWDRTFTASRT